MCRTADGGNSPRSPTCEKSQQQMAHVLAFSSRLPSWYSNLLPKLERSNGHPTYFFKSPNGCETACYDICGVACVVAHLGILRMSAVAVLRVTYPIRSSSASKSSYLPTAHATKIQKTSSAPTPSCTKPGRNVPNWPCRAHAGLHWAVQGRPSNALGSAGQCWAVLGSAGQCSAVLGNAEQWLDKNGEAHVADSSRGSMSSSRPSSSEYADDCHHTQPITHVHAM